MVQLWVNLPSSDKVNPPRYQALLDTGIPRVSLPDRTSELRVIAEHCGRHQKPAPIHSPPMVWDVQPKTGRHLALDLPEGHTYVAVVLRGTLVIDDKIAHGVQIALLGRDDSWLELEANSGVQLLVLSGGPLDGPIVGYGPFMMSSREKIDQAIEDSENGHFIRAH